MCSPAQCNRCGKRSWRGCGQHVDQVMAGVPRSQQCQCEPEPAGSFLDAVKGHLRALMSGRSSRWR